MDEGNFDCTEVNRVHENQGWVKCSKPSAKPPVDDPVIFDGGFQTHAPYQPDGLHGFRQSFPMSFLLIPKTMEFPLHPVTPDSNKYAGCAGETAFGMCESSLSMWIA